MTGEELRFTVADIENKARSTTLAPCIRPLRRFAERYQADDRVDTAALGLVLDELCEQVATDTALGMLDGPDHAEALAFLEGRWRPEGWEQSR